MYSAVIELVQHYKSCPLIPLPSRLRILMTHRGQGFMQTALLTDIIITSPADLKANTTNHHKHTHTHTHTHTHNHTPTPPTPHTNTHTKTQKETHTPTPPPPPSLSLSLFLP